MGGDGSIPHGESHRDHLTSADDHVVTAKGLDDNGYLQ